MAHAQTVTRKTGIIRNIFLSLLVLLVAAAVFIGPHMPGLLLRAYFYGLHDLIEAAAGG